MSDSPDQPSQREERFNRLLADYLEAAENGSPPDRSQWIREHAEFRPELESFFDGWDEIVTRTIPLRDPPGTPAAQEIGGYEILAEIGRGGMGVVYKARHRKLGRTVALKMIRDGRLASASEIRRFQNEAEAVALLDHPHIVPIYEVGEHDGRGWFAMKLIDGGSLADRLHGQAHPCDQIPSCCFVKHDARPPAFQRNGRSLENRHVKPGIAEEKCSCQPADGTPYHDRGGVPSNRWTAIPRIGSARGMWHFYAAGQNWRFRQEMHSGPNESPRIS